MSDGTDGLEEEQIPILFEISIESAAEWEVPVGRTPLDIECEKIRGSAVLTWYGGLMCSQNTKH